MRQTSNLPVGEGINNVRLHHFVVSMLHGDLGLAKARVSEVHKTIGLDLKLGPKVKMLISPQFVFMSNNVALFSMISAL